MAQIKIYGLKNSIEQHRAALSQAIHQAVVEALNYPLDKKFQRFIPIDVICCSLAEPIISGNLSVPNCSTIST